jgi:hypothetical protein
MTMGVYKGSSFYLLSIQKEGKRERGESNEKVSLSVLSILFVESIVETLLKVLYKFIISK